MTSALTPLHELEFETAAEHHTRGVPVAGPLATVIQDLLSVPAYFVVCMALV